MNPSLQLSGGRAHDLFAPDFARIDWAADVARPLSLMPRYSGQHGAWSVAAHCVAVADAAWFEMRLHLVAAAALLHDAHEAYLGDITRPVARALDALIGVPSLDHRGKVAVALAELKARHDRGLVGAAGLPWPLPGFVREWVADLDRRALETERRQLLGPCETPAIWGDPSPREPLSGVGPIRILPARRVEAAWLARFERYVRPAAAAQAAKARAA